MRASISALVRGLRIEQQAMIEAAAKLGSRDIAHTYYQMAAAEERRINELINLNIDMQVDEGSRFIAQLLPLVADLNETLDDDDPYAVLGQTVRVEDAVLDQYKRAIFHASETPASSVLKGQYLETSDARDAIVALRDRHVPRGYHVTDLSFPTTNAQQHS